MGIFDDAAEDIFSLDDLAQNGTYTPQGGAGVAVRVIERNVREDVAVLTAGSHRPAKVAELLQAEVPEKPRDGDTLAFGGNSYRIRKANADSAGTVWKLDMDPM